MRLLLLILNRNIKVSLKKITFFSPLSLVKITEFVWMWYDDGANRATVCMDRRMFF